MDCRLDGTKQLSEPMLEYCLLDRRNKLQRNFNRNSNIFVQQNAFESVVSEMAFCLSLNVLSHRGLVMPGGKMDIGQH